MNDAMKTNTGCLRKVDEALLIFCSVSTIQPIATREVITLFIVRVLTEKNKNNFYFKNTGRF